MSKDDFIDLIKVAEGILTLEKGCKILSGVGFDEGEGNHVFLLWNVLRRNAAWHYHCDNNLDADAENYEQFVGILENESMTPEEKYVAFME